MNRLLFAAALAAFASAALLLFVENNWYAALGWAVAGVYQLREAVHERTAVH
jgi:hypothetical protein